MDWIDVSMNISPKMMVYKNREEKKPVFKESASFDKDGVYETDIKMNLHSGTHIDFPLHTLENGHDSTSFDFMKLVCNVKVFDLTHVEQSITKGDIDSLSIGESDFILFKTKNSYEQSFNFEFIYLAEDAAEYLANKNIVGVGIDGLGIERNQEGHPTHNILLGKDIIILEGLRLKEVEHDSYKMICLPLKIDGVEALPVRAILKRIK